MNTREFLAECRRQAVVIELFSKIKVQAQRDLALFEVKPKHDAWAVIQRAIIQCDERIAAAEKNQRKLLSVIEALSNPTEKELIKLKYVHQELPFERIAEKLSYSTRQICRIHEKALQHLTELLNEAQIFDLSEFFINA